MCTCVECLGIAGVYMYGGYMGILGVYMCEVYRDCGCVHVRSVRDCGWVHVWSV